MFGSEVRPFGSKIPLGGVREGQTQTKPGGEHPYRTLADVEFATAGWVAWHNNRRFHGSLGMLTPVAFETLHYEALTRKPEPAKQRQ